jgi:hypothetical protein
METVEFILLFRLITETADMLQPNRGNMDHAHKSFPETLLHTINYKYGNHKLNPEVFDFTGYMRYEVFMARTHLGYDM